MTIELEKTYLAREIPKDLAKCKFKEIIDIYIPKSEEQSRLRIRKNGDKYEMTKKIPVNEGDASHQKEHTISLTESEFNALSKVDGKRIHKIRYFYGHDGKTAEFDVFQEDLEGLVVVDFEFDSVEEKDSFRMPEFCLADITQEDFIAGGILAGKTYSDIIDNLQKFNYKKLSV